MRDLSAGRTTSAAPSVPGRASQPDDSGPDLSGEAGRRAVSWPEGEPGAVSGRPELESASAEEVLAYGVERFGARLTLACSFQKEESVLFHMLSQLDPEFHAFVIDTGVLFPETLATWKRFEERFPEARIEVIDASSPGEPWTQSNCCSAAKVAGLERALADVDAWVTGLRREQAPTRAATPKLEHDERRGIWKLSPLADWSEKQIWTYVFAHDLPYNPLHDEGYDSIGCAPCTVPGNGREGRWAGEDKTECGIHVV